MLRNAATVTGALRRMLADRSKMIGIQRAVVHFLGGLQHSARVAMQTSGGT